MLTYLNSEMSPNCLKTKILLLELALEHDQVERTGAEIRANPEEMAKFPNAQLPAIEDDGISIAESGAIALYLARKHGQFLPKDDAGHALMFQAVFLEAAVLAPTVGGQGIFGQLMRPEAERDMDRVAKLMPEAQRIAEVLGRVLGTRDWFAGEYSIADMQLYPAVNKCLAHDIFKDPPANLRAWNERMTARPAVKEARAGYVPYK